MKIFYALFFVVALGGWGAYSALFSENSPHAAGIAVPNSQASYELPKVSQEQYVRRDLPNGAIVFERVTGQSPQAQSQIPQNLDAIAPAAGAAGIGAKVGAGVEGGTATRYDPLTQTFRRTSVDSGGNTREEIINHPANR